MPWFATFSAASLLIIAFADTVAVPRQPPSRSRQLNVHLHRSLQRRRLSFPTHIQMLPVH